MTEIVLLAINARWTHTAFGVRSVLANLGELQDRAVLIETTIKDRAVDIVGAVLEREPSIVGIGVYIWNVDVVTEVVGMLKALRPQMTVVLGGPEVVCAGDMPSVAGLADHVVSGEGEVAFRLLCMALVTGKRPEHRIRAGLPEMNDLASPYRLYTDEDIAHRKIYIEASRGCPFGCTFCLSSIDERVRLAPLDQLLHELDGLWRRGARHFRFIDRAMHCSVGPEILGFFLDRWVDGAFLHFELVPDHLPGSLRNLLPRFPDGSVQLEVGVQTFNPEVASRIGRRQDASKVEKTLSWLREETGVHIHADLVVGLPGEDLASFGAGFDRLVASKPHEIQVGMLKRLRGTPLACSAVGQGLVFNPASPYEVLETREMSYSEIQEMQRFAKHFDLVVNNGNLRESAAHLLDGSSAFSGFRRFSRWLHDRTEGSRSIALNRLARLLGTFLREELGASADEVEAMINRDYRASGRKPIPLNPERTVGSVGWSGLPERQARHRE